MRHFQYPTPAINGLKMDRSTYYLNGVQISRVVVVVILALASGILTELRATSEDSPAIPPPANRDVDFAKDILPVLRERCHQCHGASRKEARLRLDRRDDAMTGGKSGLAIIIGKSAESPLIKRVAGVDPDSVMPAEGDRLTDEQIGLLRAWIDQGAKWPTSGQHQ